MPPLRLSTFDPFGSSSQLAPATPTTPDDRKSHSPRLEARGSEPVPPPPPPRWCKPQLVNPIAASPVTTPTTTTTTEDSPSSEPPLLTSPFKMEEDTIEVELIPVDQPPRTPVRKEGRRPVQRRRKPRRRRSTAPLSPQCHHSSLADKASDYEDIWGTSPATSQDEDDENPLALRSILTANEEDTVLNDRPEVDDEDEQDENEERIIIRDDEKSLDDNSSHCSSISSHSTLEKMTSASSDRREIAPSRSLSSSPELAVLDDPMTVEIKPPSPFQEEETQRLSVTIIEIRNNSPIECVATDDDDDIAVSNNQPTIEPIIEEMKEMNKNPIADDIPVEIDVPTVRRRTSCSSTESRGETNSRRTSPLYSEPADALPPQLAVQARLKNNQQGRPLPLPPFPSASSDFSTFTKDGYVRCTLPNLSQSLSNPRVNVLPPSGQRSTVTHMNNNINNRGKQITMPKPPRPPQSSSPTSCTSVVEQRKAYPSTIYLPAPGDDSITIQVFES